MCGIAGEYCFEEHPNKDLITNMSKILEHRGPDSHGTYFNKKIGFAHRRLSIIDLSDNGKQPMFNEDNSIVLIYNGEIYNYLKLKDLLIKCGHKFQSDSDTEVIIHAYEEWGVNCLTQFNGMWAFALWDNNKQVLFCARDRFGIKPFYYTFTKNSLLFASEIKALLAHPDVGKSPNLKELKIFLSSGILDHSKHTMFNGIYQILPSHAFIINGNEDIKEFKYCELDISPNITSPISDENVAYNIIKLFKKSVEDHLRSDVPVGTCLSGGIDSSSIAKIVSMKHTMQNTFSSTFIDERFDESNYIEMVTHNTNIEPFFVEPNPNNLIKDIDHLIYIQDEPFGSLSIYAQYCVMQLAHGKCKVLLDGQGADELMGGYLAYQKNYILNLLNDYHWLYAFNEIVGTLKHHHDFYHYAINQVYTRWKRQKLLNNTVKINRYRGKFNLLLHNELFKTNLPSLLHYEDRNSMAFSIESRVPYLDVEFVNYIASLPSNQKIRNGVTKFAFRNAIKGLIPEEIRMRMDKTGFVTPEELWMAYELKDYVMNILYSTSFKNRVFWNSDKVLSNYQQFIDGKTIYSNELWRIVCVELWMRKFFDNRSTLFSSVL